MRTKEITVAGRTVSANGDNTLVKTSVGVDTLHALFDNTEWLDLGTVQVVFTRGDVRKEVSTTPTAVDSSEWFAELSCVIPWEIMQDTGSVEVTFQATKASTGEHVITQQNENVLTVVENGVVDPSTLPNPNPTPADLPIATTTSLGAVKPDGTTITVDQDGTIHGAASTLPIASASTLGGIKVGSGLAIDANGVLSVDITNASGEDF